MPLSDNKKDAMRNQLMQTIPINGERLRAYRRRDGLTQVQLAAAAEISRSYLAEIERGLKQPRFLVADALAQALGVDIDDLVGRQS